MSRAIKVLVDADEGVDIRQLSAEEREIIFEKLSAELPSIPDIILKKFLEGFNDELKKNLLLERPELVELLLKQLVLMSCSVTNLHINSTRISPPNTFLPIIAGKSVSGGEVPGLKRALGPRKITQPTGGIHLSFDRPITVSTPEGKILNVAPGDDIGVIGLRTSYDERSTDRNYKNAVPLLPTGCYRAEDLFDSNIAEFPRYRNAFKIIFEGDPTKQLIELFIRSVVFMPKSFGYFAHTLLRDAISTLPNNLLSKLLYPFSERASVIPKRVLRSEPDPILTLLNSLGVGKFTDVYHESLIAAIYGRNLADVYNNSIVDGIDSSVVQNRLTTYRNRISRAKFLSKLKGEKDAREILNSTYRTIVESKLGKTRAAEIQKLAKNDPLTYQTSGILSFLKPNERKVIELEHQKQIDYVNAVIGNKCPHVELYRKLRKSIDVYSMKANLTALSKYYSKPKEGQMIKCNNCSFNILCPHYDEYITLITESDRMIKVKLSKYVGTGESARNRDTFCRICGEVLTSIEALEGLSEDVPEYMDEELRNFIWSEVAISMKFFKFGPLIDVGKVISKVRDGIYTYIFNVEKQILRSKTTTADEVKARKRLFTAIYAYAYMVHLMMSNVRSGAITLHGFKIAEARKMIPELIKRGIELIMVSRVTTIREIPGISVDIIKNMMINAYKEISSEGVVEVKEETVYDKQIDLDPVFNAAFGIMLMDMIQSGKNITAIMKKNLYSSLQESILSAKKTSDKTIFDSVLKLLKWNTGAFDSLKMPVGTGVASVYSSALGGYIAKSHNIIAEYIRGGLFYRNESEYVSQYEELESAIADVRSKEKCLERYKALSYSRVFSKLTRPEHKFRDQNMSIGRIFDEEGKPHVWSIFVYDGTEHKEYTAADIGKLVSSGKFFDQASTDKKCSVCGVLRSQVNDLNTEKIEESLHAISTLDNFFRFYETRCPKGDLHVYSDTITCTKCGITVGSDANTKGSMGIFRQYKSVYIKDRDTVTTPVIIRETRTNAKSDANNYEEEYKSFAPNFSVVTELADKLKVNQKLLLALGATEKIEYNDIISGKYIPPEVEEINAPRVYTLDAYIRTLYIEWNQLRIFYRYQKPNNELNKLIDASGVSRQDLQNIMATLPDIYDDYTRRLEYVKRHLKPRDIIGFCLQVFCEKVLSILSADGPGAKLAALFAEYIVKKILRNDELVSKPGYFSWSVIFGDKETKQGIAEVDSDPTQEVEIDRTDDGNELAMSLEAFDVEEDPDAAPDDDPANQVRVDDKYGID